MVTPAQPESNRTPLPSKTEDIDKDGKEHINVWSKARTPLGQFLSNFTHCVIKHPTYGHFASVEGFWFWLSTGKIHHDLRRLYSTSAKSAGLQYIPVKIPDDEFRREIGVMVEIKIRSNPTYLKAFVSSVLPFDHYFQYGTKIVRHARHRWQMDMLEDLRAKLRLEFPELAGKALEVEMEPDDEEEEPIVL